MRGTRQPRDGVVGIRAVDPFVTVHPESQLELQAARYGLLADEFQHLEIAIAFRLWQLRRPYLVARNGKQERVGEEEVGIGNAPKKVVAETEAQVEAVEALRSQHGEIARPHLAVVVPGFILDIAREEPQQAANCICRSFSDGRAERQG